MSDLVKKEVEVFPELGEHYLVVVKRHLRTNKVHTLIKLDYTWGCLDCDEWIEHFCGRDPICEHGIGGPPSKTLDPLNPRSFMITPIHEAVVGDIVLDQEMKGRDHCDSCHGFKGGTPGNENIVTVTNTKYRHLVNNVMLRTLCDYCTACL